VITTDGYNLTLHRIPYSKNEDPAAVTRKPVVLVQHGILCSSTDWVIAGQNNSLGKCKTNRIRVKYLTAAPAELFESAESADKILTHYIRSILPFNCI
jgi:hypothetical protein